MASFDQLGLSNQVLKVLSEIGFEKPSEIQEKAIPHLISRDIDFIGLAQTGTGKTAAFSLPLLDRIDPKEPHTQALILAPTRELGQQIGQQINIFNKYLEKVNALAVYGGASIVTQIKALRKPQHIIIATPGRLIDLVKRKAVKLDKIKFLILDEADEMLNMGFKQELDEILAYTPEEKLVWLFSATMSREINRIVKTYMEDPFEVRLNTRNEVNTNIEHQFTIVNQKNKTEALSRFIDVNPEMRGVVFCRTRRDTQELAEDLLRKNYKADALHGDLSQRHRDNVMQRFKSNKLQLLIATDIAARGIDVNDLTHVFHFSLPDDLAYYTHRSGRTARAGKKGISIAFINGREKSKINRLVKSLDISFKKVEIPKAEDIYDSKVETWCENILEQEEKIKLDRELVDKAIHLLENVSKEELITRLLKQEMEKIRMDKTQDLNEKLSKSNHGHGRKRHHGGGRGRGRGPRNDRDRNGTKSGKRYFSKKKRS